MEPIIKLNTKLSSNSDYFLSHNKLEKINEVLKIYDFDKIFIITDKHLDTLYGLELKEVLSSYRTSTILISGLEKYKTITTLENLMETLINNNVTKSSLLIAFGGGVIGNIVGLAAALIYRGIRFIEIPTTFMGQTDSTLSNKQAVNGNISKNLFGTYYAPIFIWSDTKFVLTENSNRLKYSVVETVKNGFINNFSILNDVEQYFETDIKNPKALHEIIYKSILSKLEIIHKDPTEKGYAVSLEYGHTFGHAIEKLYQGAKCHGECVGIGMLIASEIAYKLNLIDLELKDIHYYFIEKLLGINTKICASINIDSIIESIEFDNKKNENGVRYVLLEGLNKIYNPDGDFMCHIDPNLIKEILKKFY